MNLPNPSLPWPVPMAAVALIAEAEGLRLRAYRCPAGVWTIGRGRTHGVTPGMVCTVEQADRWMCEELTARVEQIRDLLKNHAEPNQMGALVSLHYNIGHGAFSKSTVLRCHNRGDAQAAARAFGLWNKAGGQVLAGLTARRAAEAALYLKPEPDAPAERMPQAVEAESSLASSKIAQCGAVTAGSGVLLSDLPAQIGPVKAFLAECRGILVDTLGVPTEWLVPALLFGAGLAVVWWRRLAAHPSGYLFTSRGASGHIEQKALGVAIWTHMPGCELRPEWVRPRLPVADWAAHDLRRTGRTLLASMGCPAEVAELILGHMLPGVQGTYNRHSYDAERVEWLTRMAGRLEALTT